MLNAPTCTPFRVVRAIFVDQIEIRVRCSVAELDGFPERASPFGLAVLVNLIAPGNRRANTPASSP
jgi:hypothetical protein